MYICKMFYKAKKKQIQCSECMIKMILSMEFQEGECRLEILRASLKKKYGTKAVSIKVFSS